MRTVAAAELRWAIKRTLVSYVRTAAAGTVSVLNGAVQSAETFVFPSASSPTGDRLAFSGGVHLLGHEGLLDLLIRDPWLERSGDGWQITIQDPDGDDRLDFGRLDRLADTAEGLHGGGVTFTAGGAELIFGPYEEGTELDDLDIHWTIGPC